MTTKAITVKYLARVEGEGGLNIQIEDNAVTGVQLRIFEPPRFEFLGRNFTSP
jgi:coenzyme F420-reducing hydrogenase alpha subunit